MRTIKFRGIDTMSGEMVYGDLVQQELTDGSITTAIVHTYATYDVKPETVGQFTGLHDKNGNEIYEGDIVSIEAIKSRINKVVEWNSERACWDAGGENRIDLYAFCYCEVIGNIYDNPEIKEG